MYREVTKEFTARRNLVPDAHLAALLRQHDIRTLYTTTPPMQISGNSSSSMFEIHSCESKSWTRHNTDGRGTAVASQATTPSGVPRDPHARIGHTVIDSFRR